jgi:hypothetical protein
MGEMMTLLIGVLLSAVNGFSEDFATRAQNENLHLAGRAELPLCPEFLGGAAAPPYRRREDFCPAPHPHFFRIFPLTSILISYIIACVMVRNEWKVAERRNAGCPSIAGRGLRIADSRPLREKSAILLPSLRSLVAIVFPALQKNRPGRVMREPSIRAILSYFELFRVNSSSAFTIQHSKFTIISTPTLQHSTPQ